MKIRYKIVMFIVVIFCLVVLIWSDFFDKKNDTSDTVDEWWERKLSKYNLEDFTIEEKIGQMMIISSNKTKYDGELNEIIEGLHPGGFIVMGENITTYEDTLNLINEIKKNSLVPMFIAIDEEGGRVQRLTNLTDVEIAMVPEMYFLGNTNNVQLAYQVGEILAKQVRTLGVNLNFAPVLDIYSNLDNKVIGYRSFGRDKYVVSRMGEVLLKGLEDNMVMGCVKHFPGHGDTNIDSHVDLPIVNKSYEELMKNELLPFKNAIEKGAKMIMVGHIALPKITLDNTPASLSKEVVTDILRNKLNYKGLIITDGLGMQGVNKGYSEEEVYINAIKAGVDILLSPKNPDKVISTVMNAIRDGNISEKRIDDSVNRILLYKEAFIYDNSLDKSFLNRGEYSAVLEKILVE